MIVTLSMLASESRFAVDEIVDHGPDDPNHTHQVSETVIQNFTQLTLHFPINYLILSCHVAWQKAP